MAERPEHERKPAEGKGPEDGLNPMARQMRTSEPYISAVWQLVNGAVFGVVGGYFLDKWLGTGPWFLLGLSVAGIGVGFYAFLRTVLRLGKKK